ncbi:virulence factor [Paenibacillus sp. P26]|nr:virulence factor [Paenibacillus sp. P26]
MPIIHIEPTPSPNTMKINLTERSPEGIRQTFHREQADKAPEPLNLLLAIEGVKSLYRATDFIALDRTPKGDWQQILVAVREVLGAADGAAGTPSAAGTAPFPEDAAFGEVQVKLQHFRGIPLQVRVTNGREEKRALPQRFSDAAIRGAAAAPNLIKERSLDDWDTRYGELQEVLDEVIQELDASYSDERARATHCPGGRWSGGSRSEGACGDPAASAELRRDRAGTGSARLETKICRPSAAQAVRRHSAAAA